MRWLSVWTNADCKVINPTEYLTEGQIVKCESLSENMCRISVGENFYFVRQDRLQLLEKKKQSRKAYTGNTFSKKSELNFKTKLEAFNDGKEWSNEELEEIFLSSVQYPAPVFPDKQILEFCERFKRTYFAVEAIVRVRDEFKKTGKMRDFYFDSNKELSKTGTQLFNILEKLKKEDKL